ncbi:unnamed protein product [Ambrosiozyma monospora]|uniref:Unnamed protein product n=1 Tax=Ambrosiozyma monospora TaxID=43982 RepID=A0ACB5T7Y6_AMBMO|nr:unnamed protein product [Ambrosiozyma monospora]
MPAEIFETQKASLEKSYESSDHKRRIDINNRRRGNYGMYDGSKKIESDELKNLDQNKKDEMVRNHYNLQAFHARQGKRTESPIYKLRSFNNCIKYILINKYAKPYGNVLDLGCGKGGDMGKWDQVLTRSYVGIDLSDQSIKEAVSRYQKSRFQFEAVFATGDAFTMPVPQILADFENEVDLQFDTVSMQFCMHYAFNSEATVRTMLENVSRSLKVGGIFIGTIPSSDFIKWKIKRLGPGEKKWGNSIYSVEFPEPPPKDGKFPKMFGNVYSYYLVDAVDNVPEFVVPFEKFRSLCEEYNLELRFKKNFFELFNREIGNYFNKLPGPLIESLRKPDGSYGVTGEDRDACSFYLAFAFEKTSA